MLAQRFYRPVLRPVLRLTPVALLALSIGLATAYGLFVPDAPTPKPLAVAVVPSTVQELEANSEAQAAKIAIGYYGNSELLGLMTTGDSRYLLESRPLLDLRPLLWNLCAVPQEDLGFIKDYGWSLVRLESGTMENGQVSSLVYHVTPLIPSRDLDGTPSAIITFQYSSEGPREATISCKVPLLNLRGV